MKIKNIRFIFCVLSAIMPSVYVMAQNRELFFNGDGRFRIVQFTDVHYKTGTEGGEKSMQVMKMVLDSERPDLVVFTGDVVVCEPQRPGWDEVLSVVIERKIPYAVVLGNHGDEQDWTRKQIFDYISKKPYSLSQAGLGKLKGTGNYVLNVFGDRKKKADAILYFFDSNAYNKTGRQEGYDWLGFDQVDWYRKTSRSLTNGNGNNPYPALAFFHIPLHEYTLLSDTTKNYVKASPVFGIRNERECPGLLNTGMFAAMVESGDVMGVFVGHDHDNDYIGRLNGVCLAYGRFIGANNSYNKIGCGARVIELTKGSRSFDTWIRDENGQVLYKVSSPASFE